MLTSSHTKEVSASQAAAALSWRRLYLARAKLKASSRTSALLSGFAMVAMVEADFTGAPDGLLVTFSIVTTLVVTIHLLALMISTCILPNLEAVSNVYNATAVAESPHDKMKFYIEMAWILSTGVGILLFLAQIAILAWVRFYSVYVPVESLERKLALLHTQLHANESSFIPPPPVTSAVHSASIASTAIIVPAIVIFILFATHFYRQLISHKYEQSAKGLDELDTMLAQIDTSRLHQQKIV